MALGASKPNGKYTNQCKRTNTRSRREGGGEGKESGREGAKGKGEK